MVVNEINIDVTKKMPETLPDAFRVRGATGTNAIKYNETVFLRPIQGPQNRPWYINWFDKDDKDSNYGFDDVDSKQILWASDTRPYGFEEMFAGIMPNNIVAQMDRNYKFVFEGCGNYDDDKIDGDAVSVYDNPAG